MNKRNEEIYVGIFKKDDNLVGFTFGGSREHAGQLASKSKTSSSISETLFAQTSEFEKVMRRFVSTIETYKSFKTITSEENKNKSALAGVDQIENLLSRKGLLLEGEPTDNKRIYKISYEHLREFILYSDQITATLRGFSHIPEVFIIGLVSAFDAFLSKLLTAIFRYHPESILRNDKLIPYAEIADFDDINNIRDYLINKEVETVIRMSHQEQFHWMEKNFSVKLREGLSSWPAFVEICERRNLLTHTGGIISRQYLQNCKEHKYNTKALKLGDKLSVGSAYYAESVDIIAEIGIKLSYVMWRKFAVHEVDRANTVINELCFELIFRRSYKLAEALLSFTVDVLKKGGRDRTRRMMIVNLANAIRLQGRTAEAASIIEREDWSAVSPVFQICSKAASGDLAGVLQLMSVIGPSNPELPAEGYSLWPVFREHRSSAEFNNKFEEIFGRSVINDSSIVIEEDGKNSS